MPHPESAPLDAVAFAGGAVDRDHAARERPALFDELLADPRTRVVALHGERLLFDARGDLALRDPAEVTASLLRVYLGRTREATAELEAGSPVLAAVLTPAAAGELEPDASRWRGLRGRLRDLGAVRGDLAVEAVGIANWHAAAENCAVCGIPTVVEAGGWSRRCLRCGREVFPRTDPAVIVGVVDDRDRLLLGSNTRWEANRWSVLAGFVEPGESFEAAARREIHEEAGVRIDDLRYLGSQPWPFPASVMVAFTARLADAGEASRLEPDGEELRALHWYERADLWADRAGILLPGPGSIARAIIERWYGGPLEEPPRGAG